MEEIILSHFKDSKNSRNFSSIFDIAITEQFFTIGRNKLWFFNESVYFDTTTDKFCEFNGKIEGHYLKFDYGKKIEEAFYHNGKIEGHNIGFYSNGRKEFEGDWLHGLQHGLWTHYWMNGNKSREGLYENGNHIGIWRYYNEYGIEAGKRTWKK